MPTNRLLSALAVALLCGCVSARVVTTPAPTPAPGSHIRYATRPDPGNLVAARLVSLDASSMVSERFVAGPTFGKWVREAIATDSLALLQVRIGRDRNPGKGALFGAVSGLALGILCAATVEDGWLQPTPEECVAGYIVMGVGTGALVGLLARSDVWAPATLPGARPQPVEAPVALRAEPLRFGFRIPFGRLGP